MPISQVSGIQTIGTVTSMSQNVSMNNDVTMSEKQEETADPPPPGLES